MTDDEIVTLAVKAYGDAPLGFSPLTDDGDALRLAVKIYMFDGSLFKRFMAIRLEETRLNPARSDEEITRRAIVRAAAEIGKGLSQPITNDVPEDNPS